MTLDSGSAMAEGKDPGESKCHGDSQLVTVNGHIGGEDHQPGSSSDFSSSILGHPSSVLIITNVADGTFVSADVKVILHFTVVVLVTYQSFISQRSFMLFLVTVW